MKHHTKAIVAGLVGFSLTVVAGFVPWIQCTWQADAEIWLGATGVWGPPAYISALPEATYATVKIEPGSQTSLYGIMGLYLLIFLIGIGLWIRILWANRSIEQKWITLGGGIVSIIIGVGVVLLVGLAEVIAQRTGLYAAITTDRVVTATLDSIQAPGPLLLLTGIVLEAIALFGSRRAAS